MLGLVGKQREYAGIKTTVKSGKNTYTVCLNPWDIVEDVPISSKYPDGKKITPAASQDDFKLILAKPGVTYIGELNAQQEADAIASLEKNCAWYIAELKKNKPAAQATTNTNQKS